VKKILFDCFTEADGKTWDLGRIQWFVGTLVFFGMTGWVYGYKGQMFDPAAFGTGLGLVLAAGGGMIWMKDKEKEPHHDMDTRSPP
jgi:hypothetical protein